MGLTKKEWLILAASIGLAGLFCFFVVNIKGIGQLGNVLSFFGAFATLYPLVRQLLINRRYTRTIEMQTREDLEPLNQDLERQRGLSFASFQLFDLVMVVIGMVLLTAGFLTAIISSPNI